MNKARTAQFLIPAAALTVLFPFVPPAVALLSGIVLALTVGNPFPTRNYVHLLLGISVAGLGAGMNLEVVARAGIQGFGITAVSIAGVFFLGMLLKKLLKVESQTAILICAGTAICGGSAIAAVAPVIRAKPHSVSVSLAIIFVLNAVALFVFPSVGHYFNMSQADFGWWSALAIHDTSSVVGATVAYGAKAAEIGTTVKLARALWIVPLTLLIGYFYKDAPAEEDASNSSKPKKPWFILWFLAAAALVTWVPGLQPTGEVIEVMARRLMVLTLFLIGLGISKDNLKKVGIEAFELGINLWLITASIALIFALKFNV